MGWDEKNRPMGQNFSSRPMGWDSVLKIFIPAWDGTLLKNFSFRPIPSHVIPWDGMGQYTHQISFIKNKIS
jgi:hypothetical protein